MARKVFISFLGTSSYVDCHYVKPDTDYEITNPYIQVATLDYLKKSGIEWENGDVVLILLTEKAEIANWQPHGLEVGLEARLKMLNLPYDSIPNLPEGDTVDDIMTIFIKTFNKLKEGDELYFDITHGFRLLPMLIMVLTNYVKFTKTCKVKWISYGKTVYPFEEGTIVDLCTLTVLQDWTTGAADFVDNGNVDKLVTLSSNEMQPILQEAKGSNKNANSINNFVKKLDLAINDIKMCRCKDVIEAKTIKNLRNYAEKIDMSAVVQPFGPIVDRIMKSLKGFSSQRDIFNGLAAANWCLEHSLYQQAITFLEETIISFVCDKYQINLDNIDQRDIVSNSFDILNQNTPENDWKLGKKQSMHDENKKLYRQLIQDPFVIDFYPKVCHIKGFRNDMNHAGMRENSMKADDMKNTIKKAIEEFTTILNNEERPVIDNLSICHYFLNLSNHPSSNWSEEQLAAAQEYGEIKDLHFPNIDENLDDEGIDALADEYLEKIKTESGSEPCTVHIMGEMTFTYALVNKLKAEGYTCVASTSWRDVEIMPDGSKQVKFHFCRFRKY